MSEPFDKFRDPFAPPKVPCEVRCIHCGSTYDSWRIEWRDMPGEAIEGAWCCPVVGCDGIGFQFDIHPLDPDWSDSDSAETFNAKPNPFNTPMSEMDTDEDEDEGEWTPELESEYEDEEDEDEAEFALAFDDDEDDDDLPIDEFDEDAFWIAPERFMPKGIGNTPQPPFDEVPFGKSTSGDMPFKDDDIPF